MNLPKKHYFLHLIGLIFPLFTLLSAYIYYDFSKRTILVYFVIIIFAIYSLQLIKNKKVYTTYLILTSLFISFFSFIEISHFIIFKDAITESSIYIALETNTSELSEFVSSYFKNSVLLYALFHLLSFIIGIYFAINKVTILHILQKKTLHVSLLFLLMSITIYRYRTYFLPYTVYNSSLAFLEQREALNSIKISKKGHFTHVKSENTKEEIAVIIIGESTTRDHMSLYNYYRNTNPLLSKRLGLTLFTNVKTPHTHTIPALGDVLVLNNTSLKNKYNSTLIQLMNSANYKTYFISNQKPIGIYETSITLISKTSDQSYFTAVSDNKLDEAIFKPLTHVLNDDAKQKFILIHLMGTHQKYSKRYSSAFNFFKDIPKTKYKHQDAYSSINQYDNAIRYNDFIVNEIIEKVNNYNSSSYVLYFSDHGEDVYETIDEACHTESKGTAPMYNIPFMIWQSKKYQNSHKAIENKDLPYNSKYLIHTVADLSQIKFTKFNKNKSIINKDYKTND